MEKIDKKLLSLMSLFLLVFGLFVSVVVFNKPLSQFTRASGENNPSPDKSIILVSDVYPIKVGIKTSVTVFVVSNMGTPLKNKTVTLSASLGQIETNNIVTDATGKATFSLSSNLPGESLIEATVDNTLKINKKVSLKFIP